MSQLKKALEQSASPALFKERLNIRGADAGTDTANFGGILSSADDTVQKALDTIDDIFASSVSITGDLTVTGNGEFISTDAGAGAGPSLSLYRNSASPLANDEIPEIAWNGEDSAGNKEEYATDGVLIADPTSTNEDAIRHFSTVVGGTLAKRLNIAAGLYTPSATGGDKGADTVNASELYEGGVRVPGRITTLTASDSANLAWSSIPSGARRIIIRLRNLDPATDDVQLYFTVTVSGTRQTGASDYQWTCQVYQSTDATATRGDVADTEIEAASGPAGFGISNAHSGVSGTIILEDPNSTSVHKHVDFKTGYIRAGADEYRINDGVGVYQSTSAVDGFDLRMSSDNIASGTVDVYVEY